VKAAGFPNLLFHDLRRSCVRSLVRSGVSRSVAREISGHKSESVFERYNITSEADIRDAAEKMSRFHSPAPKNGDNSGTKGQKEAGYQ
jgi:integrase